MIGDSSTIVYNIHKIVKYIYIIIYDKCDLFMRKINSTHHDLLPIEKLITNGNTNIPNNKECFDSESFSACIDLY